MLAVTGFVPLLVNLKSMTSKPKADGGSKNCVPWKVEKASALFCTYSFIGLVSSKDYYERPGGVVCGKGHVSVSF